MFFYAEGKISTQDDREAFLSLKYSLPKAKRIATLYNKHRFTLIIFQVTRTYIIIMSMISAFDMVELR